MFQTKSAMGNPYGDDTIDIKQQITRFSRRWYWFVICTVLAGSFAFMQLRSSLKIYRTKATIILNNSTNETTSFETILKNYKIPIPQQEIANEIGMLSSFRLIRSAIEKMDLGISYGSEHKFKKFAEYKDTPFEIRVDSSHHQLVGLPIYIKRISPSEYRVQAEGSDVNVYDLENHEIVRQIGEIEIDRIVKVGEPFVSNHLSFNVHYKPDYETYYKEKYFFRINTLDGLAQYFQGSLSVNLVNEDANIIGISHEGPLVEVSKHFISQLLEEYKEDELSKKRELGERTRQVLQDQITEASGEISGYESAITQVQVGGQIFDPSQTAGALNLKINDLESQRSREKVVLEYYRSVLMSLENNPNAGELPSPSGVGVHDQVLTNLILELSKLNQEKAALKLELTEGSPLLAVNEMKIRNTRREIMANVQTSMNATQLKLDDITIRLSQAQREKGAIPGASAAIQSRTRNLQTSEERFKQLREQLDFIELALSTITVDLEVIDSPKQEGNKAIKPKKSFFMIIALFIGVVLPAVVIILKDFFDKSISSVTDIEGSTNIPVLGFIARHDRNSSYIVPKNSRTALAESFRSVRIKLQFLNEEGGTQQVIGLTSSTSGEGKTFCATNLAAVFAQSGRRTLLVDVDLRRPRVTRYFENGDGRGLSTYLIGEVKEPMEIVHKTHIENLDVIHSGPVCSNPLDLMSSGKMQELIDKFRQNYDHIILDTPPVGLVSDYLVIMQMTDFNVYVVRDTTTNVDALKMINELYDTEKIKNVSILINDVKSLSNYGYIDKYYGYGDE